MTFILPQLRYSANALEPSISRATIDFHYGKHHQTYVNNLNNLAASAGFENASLEKIIMEAEGPLFNNGAQVWNHTFYFNSLSPVGSHEPSGKIAEAVNRKYGSYENFKTEFSKAAVSIFGSGWAWLVKGNDGELDILQESNAGNPLRKEKTPLLTFDVWEHAYYLDYQNNRAAYIQNLWNILNWDIINERYI
jgi:superoxide dismutase, Fe-Mn family